MKLHFLIPTCLVTNVALNFGTTGYDLWPSTQLTGPSLLHYHSGDRRRRVWVNAALGEASHDSGVIHL